VKVLEHGILCFQSSQRATFGSLGRKPVEFSDKQHNQPPQGGGIKDETLYNTSFFDMHIMLLSLFLRTGAGKESG
jgi:hypothetical protein